MKASKEVQPAATLTIRSATPGDYELCLSLDHSISTSIVWQMVLEEGEVGAGAGALFREVTLPRSMKVQYPRDLEALQRSWRMHAVFLVAQWDREIIGYINVRQEIVQETAWISDLVVDTPARMRGIGTALINAARDWALEQGLRRIIVETQTKNYPGISLLKKRGFSFCGYNDLYFPNHDIALFFGQTLR